MPKAANRSVALWSRPPFLARLSRLVNRVGAFAFIRTILTTLIAPVSAVRAILVGWLVGWLVVYPTQSRSQAESGAPEPGVCFFSQLRSFTHMRSHTRSHTRSRLGRPRGGHANHFGVPSFGECAHCAPSVRPLGPFGELKRLRFAVVETVDAAHLDQEILHLSVAVQP